MNTEKIVWQGEGELWRNLSIGDDGLDWVLHLTNATTSFMKDQEKRLTRTLRIEQVIDYIKKEDADYCAELGLYGEEG